MLEIIGNSKDGVWLPNGLVSREFKGGNIKIETEFKASGDNFFAVIGLIDENGEGIGLGIDKRYFQYYETGKEPESYVPAINFRNKSATHKLEITYKNGQVSITVDDLTVVEGKEKELSDKIRIMILSDGIGINSKTRFKVIHLALENRN